MAQEGMGDRGTAVAGGRGPEALREAVGLAGVSTGGIGVVHRAGSGGRDGYQAEARAETGVLFAKSGSNRADGKAGAGKSIRSGGCVKNYFFLFDCSKFPKKTKTKESYTMNQVK